jgi:hypothetical protein
LFIFFFFFSYATCARLIPSLRRPQRLFLDIQLTSRSNISFFPGKWDDIFNLAEPPMLNSCSLLERSSPVQKGQYLPSPLLAASSPHHHLCPAKSSGFDTPFPLEQAPLHCKQVTEFLGYFSQDKDAFTFVQ